MVYDLDMATVMGSAPKRRKRGGLHVLAPVPDQNVLYFSPTPAHKERLFKILQELQGSSIRKVADGVVFVYRSARFHFEVHDVPERAHEALRRRFFNFVLLDLRSYASRLGADFRKTCRLLDLMDEGHDVERRFGFHRIFTLVWGAQSEEVDRIMTTLGARGVGRVIRDMSSNNPDPSCLESPEAHATCRKLLDEFLTVGATRRPGKIAFCASGGGITGIYFEMGALKCLDDCLPPGALNSFDMYFGISAGSVVASVLANGFTIDEFMASIAGVPGRRVPSISLGLLHPAHFNFQALWNPVERLMSAIGSSLLDALKGKNPFSLETLFLEYNNLLTAPFHAAGFEMILRRLFSTPGSTNDFRKLPRRLFIGTTDQDSREHVIFGDPPFDHVPISKAVQASVSINPAFTAAEIDGRYYMDGAVTRTSNFVEAIKKGCTLIFAIDPFVPYVSKSPGFSRERGVLFNADQDIRTLSFTRFEKNKSWVLRRHPEVSLYTFLPANRLRKLMSDNPMDHRPYLQIWKGAYLSTLQRIRQLKHQMGGDLAGHGLTLDLSRAETVAKRLESIGAPAISDFFPDGRLSLRRRPLPASPEATSPVVVKRPVRRKKLAVHAA